MWLIGRVREVLGFQAETAAKTIGLAIHNKVAGEQLHARLVGKGFHHNTGFIANGFGSKRKAFTALFLQNKIVIVAAANADLLFIIVNVLTDAF